ncbi:hypothetical protein [Kitasatospora sp. GAS1066B]|uniref:hypothetical protein n=1 Tax=Kitasatospora sp. GAS1066B TaxID=3156271 RepID=UPI003513B01C
MLSAARPVHRAAVHRVAVHRAAVHRAALRRAAALLAVTALTALPVAAPARADTPEAGRADAVTAELALDVSLLNSTVAVPVDIALNKVESPAEQHGSVLSANVAGVAQPGPVTLVKADVGSSVTHLDARGASAAVQLLNADVHAPGLPASTLLGLRALSASVSCPVDGSPTATVNMPATLSVLGHQVSLRATGPTHVDVPAIGSVDIEFAPRSTTSSTAAAAALSVHVALNPLNLNVAKVDGTITVASVSCVTPGAAAAPSMPASAPASAGSTVPGPPASGPAAPGPVPVAQVAAAASPTPGAATPTPSRRPAAPAAALAFTGNTSVIPLLAGAAALMTFGAAAIMVSRRRRATHRR